MADIRQIQTALAMYYADHGEYPTSGGGAFCGSYTTVPNGSWCNSVQKNADGRWIANGALAPYLPQDPVDPKPASTPPGFGGGGTYFYASVAGAGWMGCPGKQHYYLTATMEVASNATTAPTIFCDGTTYNGGGNYRVLVSN